MTRDDSWLEEGKLSAKGYAGLKSEIAGAIEEYLWAVLNDLTTPVDEVDPDELAEFIVTELDRNTVRREEYGRWENALLVDCLNQAKGSSVPAVQTAMTEFRHRKQEALKAWFTAESKWKAGWRE